MPSKAKFSPQMYSVRGNFKMSAETITGGFTFTGKQQEKLHSCSVSK